MIHITSKTDYNNNNKINSLFNDCQLSIWDLTTQNKYKKNNYKKK